MCHGSRLSRFDWGWETSHLYIIGILKWVYKPLLLGWWVHPLLYGNNRSLDSVTYHYPTLQNGSSKEPWEEKTRWFWGGYSWWRPKKVSCQSHLLNGYAPQKKNASAATLHETNIIPNWWIFAKHQFSILTALIIWWTTSSPVRTIKRQSRKKRKKTNMFTRPTSARFWAKRRLFSNSLIALSNKSIQLALVPGIYISHRIHVWQNVGKYTSPMDPSWAIFAPPKKPVKFKASGTDKRYMGKNCSCTGCRFPAWTCQSPPVEDPWNPRKTSPENYPPWN